MNTPNFTPYSNYVSKPPPNHHPQHPSRAFEPPQHSTHKVYFFFLCLDLFPISLLPYFLFSFQFWTFTFLFRQFYYSYKFNIRFSICFSKPKTIYTLNIQKYINKYENERLRKYIYIHILICEDKEQ